MISASFENNDIENAVDKIWQFLAQNSALA